MGNGSRSPPVMGEKPVSCTCCCGSFTPACAHELQEAACGHLLAACSILAAALGSTVTLHSIQLLREIFAIVAEALRASLLPPHRRLKEFRFPRPLSLSSRKPSSEGIKEDIVRANQNQLQRSGATSQTLRVVRKRGGDADVLSSPGTVENLYSSGYDCYCCSTAAAIKPASLTHRKCTLHP